VMLID
jgi:hypothetical protein